MQLYTRKYVLATALLLLTASETAVCFVPMFSQVGGVDCSHLDRRLAIQFSTKASDEFSEFAASLDDDSSTTTSSSSSGSSNARKTSRPNKKSSSSSSSSNASWQTSLDELLDPTTSLARRQILLSELMNANAEIRASVQKALIDRRIDPLLTPNGKRLQEGTRAVARQLTNDILPSLLDTSRSQQSQQPPPIPGLPPLPFPPRPQDITKVGSRILSALQNQAQRNLEIFQNDLKDPSRIPERITKQTETLVKEAANVFSETPAGLQEPPYTVVLTTDDYEIRDYQAYTVASTNMATADETYSMDNVAQTGAAFNSLAAYLFGANRQGQAMEMTTPVTTTMNGEMRFYLYTDSATTSSSSSNTNTIPDPFEQDEAKSAYETGNILIQSIPAARLAVRRFTGFVTEGEISRQKQALLAALDLDGVELDVPHGQAVGHLIFQYNPPYTLPVLRRNEIAVPVLMTEDDDDLFDSSSSTNSNGLSSKKTQRADPWDGGYDEDAAELRPSA